MGTSLVAGTPFVVLSIKFTIGAITLLLTTATMTKDELHPALRLRPPTFSEKTAGHRTDTKVSYKARVTKFIRLLVKVETRYSVTVTNVQVVRIPRGVK